VNRALFESSPAASAPAAGPGIRPGRILVVDDDPTNRAVASGYLARWGVQVSFAENGRAAVETWRAGTFDLVLMDCMMPDVDGFQATSEIRRIEGETGLPRTPVIALTAAAMPEDRKKCFAAGMDDYVSKPVRRAHLAAALERWMPAGTGAPAEPAETLVGAPAEAPPAAAGSPSVLDLAALEPLRGCRRGGPSLLQKAVLSYVENTPKLMSELKSALSSGRWDDAHRFAHTIKSSSATLGARRVSELARSVEMAAGNRADVPESMLISIESEYEMAVAELAGAFEQEP
jgi:two-component system, sensor histidine kinase and response regulator